MRTHNQEFDILLSPGGLKKIEQELDRLKSVDRKRVAERIREATSFGEFSENSEYEDAKNEQAFIECRVQELQAILKHASIIDESGIPVDYVGVGSVVKVLDLEDMQESTFKLVGPVEADPGADCISHESPLGQALMDARVGDIVEVQARAGLMRMEVLSIGR